MEDKFLAVYDGLRQKNPDMPDYNKFKSDLQQNEQARADVYNGLKKNNPDMPDFETFSNDMGLVGGPVRQENKGIDQADDNIPDIGTLKKDYNDFMSQNKEFLDRYREDEKRRLALSPTPMGVPFMLSSLFKTDKQREEDKRYKELSEKEKELSQAISTHPETLGKKKIMLDSIDESMRDLDTMMRDRRKNIPVSYANTSIGGIVMGEGSDLELNRLDAANKMYKDAKELLKAPSKFDDSNPFVNFMKGVGDTFNDRDFWSFGLTEIGRNLKMKNIFKKISDNTEGKDLDQILTPGEQKMFEAFTDLSLVEAERAKDLSLGYSAGEGAAESLKFMAEFIATGGVASAASSAAKKAVSKWLINHTKKGLMRELGNGLVWGTESGLSTLARTPLMPSTYVNVTDPSNQFETDENGDTLLDENGNPVLKSGWKVFRDGFVDSFIENVSEMSGAHIAGVLGVGGDIAGKLVPKKVQNVFSKTGDMLSKSKPGEMFSRFSKSPVWKFLKQGGYNGLLEEWGEEWYGAALRSVLTDPSALKDYATVENQLVTVASFLPMSVFGGGVAAGQTIRAKEKYNTTLGALQGLMGRLGYDDNRIAYLTDQIEAASAQKMASTITPLINNLAAENEESAGELFKAVSDFARAKGDYHLINGAYQERMADLKAEEDRRIEEETGGYVNSSTGNVEIVLDNEGNAAYVVGETLSDGHKVYILNKGGEKVPVSREEFEEEYKPQGIFSKDEFLGTIIMNRDLTDYISSESGDVAGVGNEEVVNPSENIGGGGVATYQGKPVQIVEGTEQEDGSVIIEDEDGETIRVMPEELEIKDVAEEQPVESLQEEASPIQEKTVESEIPMTDKGTPDYDSMSPDMFAVEFEKEFGADAAKAELEQMVSDIDDKVDKLQKKSLTNRNERAENMREIARLKGERDGVLKAFERYAVPEEVSQEEQPVFSNEEEAVRWVMENSDDINEVLGTYESVRGLQKDAALPRWQQELQGIKINPESFYRESDRNLATPELKRGWLSRNGRSIDDVAHDLSNYGIEVTPQDIVDFMLENPSGRVRQKNSELDALGQRFSELATKAAGVKIGKPDSPTGKLFIENLRTSNNMEQLRNQINDAQRAEEEVLRSMAEQRDAERGNEQDIKPIGKGFFGNIYDQFKGKANEAIRFLMKQKDGEAIGALHHPQVGDIDLVWGEEGTSHSDGYGLSKIAKYHPDVLANLQEILNDMSVVNASANRMNLESDTHKAAVRLEWDGEKKTWLLTAFEKEAPASIDKTTDTDENHKDLQGDTALLQNTGVSSEVKDKKSLVENQEMISDTEKIRKAESEVELHPTEAQQEAGNYKKGHVRIDGYDITIENPKGSERSGTDVDGKPWSIVMNNTYGYIRGTKGVDGDHIDVFLSDSPDSGNVYVVDQIKKDGSFDEHKVMYGFPSIEDAKSAYLSNYSPGWKGLGAITEASKDEFKKWIDSSKRKTKPFAEYKSVKKESGENQGEYDVRFREEGNDGNDESDKTYMDAVKRGDMETAQRMVNDAAEKSGYNIPSDYQGSLAFNGAAPSKNAYFDTKEDRRDAWNNGEYEGEMSLGDFVDSGIDTHDLEWQLTDPRATYAEPEYTKKSISNLASAVKNGSKKIKMYRAVDASVKESSFRNGDWITPSREYAKHHIELQDWKKGRIIEQEVSIEDIWWDGNDINEWGYDDGKEYGYRNTANSRKLLEPVTYDDSGNVIPLSKRFNVRNPDPRFRFIGEKGAANLDKAEEATTRLDNLGVAREMEKSGKDAKVIKLATGWERGADGKWRYEEDDFEYRPLGDANKDALLKRQPWYDEFNSLLDKVISGEELTKEEEKRLETLTDAAGEIKKSNDLIDRIYLDDYVKDDNLFKAYPELKTMTIVFGTYPDKSYAGLYDESENKIVVNLAKADDARSVIAHEIQHIIQRIEGFERGGNPMILYPFGSKNILAKIEEANEFIEKYGDDFLLQARKGDDKDFSNNAIFIIKLIGRNKKKMTALDGRFALMDLYTKKGDIKPIGFSGYKRLAGEVEARNVQRRMDMTPEERRNILASETEDVAREDQLFLNDALGGVSASMDTSVEEANRRFNEELDKLTEENAGNIRLTLGNPSSALRSAGIPGKPLVLYGNKLMKKAKKHGFDVKDVKDLPNALQRPIGIFSGSHPNSFAILTEMNLGDKKVLVSVETNKDGEVDFNLVSSVFGKNDKGVIKWILDGKLRNVDKGKALAYISASAPIADATYKKELDSATNIVKNFENPTVLGGEISSSIDELSDELGVPVNKVKSRNDLPEGIQRQMKNGRYPGLFDPKTGQVYMVMDEITDAADAQATMLHEIIGHKGIRGLFGDRIGEFTSRVLDSMPEAERKKWVDRYNGNEQLAAEEYVARFAEGYENPSMWEKIKAIFRDLLRDLGIDLKLSDNDLKYTLWKGVRSMQQDGTMLGTAEYVSKDREIQRALFREERERDEFTDRKLNLGEWTREAFQDRMLSVKMLLDEIRKRGGKVTDYSNPYVAENMATSKSKAQIDDFNKRLWEPLMGHVKTFSEKGKTREDIDHYMMAKHAPERNALLMERNGVENGSGMTDADAEKVVSEFEKGFDKESIDAFWNNVREATRFTVDTWQKHGLIDKATRDYYNNMYQYYVPLRGWEVSEADNIEYLDGSRKGGSVNVNKRAKGRSSLADSPLAYIANMAHSAIVSGNKNDIKRNVFEMMALNKNPDLYHLKKVYHVNTGTKENPIWIEQLEKPDAKLWNEGRVKVDVNRKNDARREFYKTKQHQVEAFVNGQKYVMEFNGNMGVRVANAINGLNVIHSELLQNTVGQVTRWMSANFTSKNPEFVVTNFLRDFGYAIPAYWIKGGKASVLLKNMPKAFRAIHNDIAGKNVDSELQKMYEEFKMNGGLTGYVHMTDIDSYKKWIERDIRKRSGDKTFGDVVLRNKAMRAGADLLEYLAQMSENSTRFAVYMSERQSGKSVTEAAYAAKEITTNFNRKGRYSGMLGSLYGFFNATVQGTANALGLAKRSPGKFGAYCGALIMLQFLSSSLCRMLGGDDEIGENNYDRLADWVKYNNLVLPDLGKEGRFITIPLPHFFRALSSLGVIGGEVLNGVKTPGKGLEAIFDAVSGDLTPVEIATPQFKNLPSFLMSVTPTAFKPIAEAYAFNRNFMNLPISREAMGDQKKTLPQNKLAKKTTNPTLVSISKWLNEAAGGGEYTTAEIGYDDETGEVGRNDWKTWMDVNPAKFEHVVEGIFGGRLKFFNNIYKTASNVLTGEFEASTTPIIRPLYQTPKGESAWIKFYEVRDEVVDIDAKASEFMKTGNYDAYGMINYRNAQLVETYKAYETIIKSLNDALKMVSDPEQASEIEKKKDDVVKEFAIEVKKLEKEYKASQKKKEVVK